MPNEIRPRLDSDVVKLVAKHAAANGRTPPSEVNFALRRYYSDGPVIVAASGKNKFGGRPKKWADGAIIDYPK